jgi:L-arabinose isomerase
MKTLGQFEVWLAVGSQVLYGDEVIATVDARARELAASLDASAAIPVTVVPKPVLTSADAIRRLCLDATADDRCVGVIAWMHTFSPARMWIGGLRALRKPLLHLHTQFNRELPWAEIDMDFMNLNQSAHGDREFGYIATRLGVARKTVAGHWQDEAVQQRISTWTRAACGWAEARQLKIARLGDNMRHVAATEGDKVDAEIVLGFAADGYGVGDLVALLPDAASVQPLVAEYRERYRVADNVQSESLVEAARIEVALRASSRIAAASRSQTPSRTCMGSASFPASRLSG